MTNDHIGQIFRDAIQLDQDGRDRLLKSLPASDREQLVMLLDADSEGEESGLLVSIRAHDQVQESGSLINRRIRDYELREIIGEGGVGTVYRAHHLRLKCDVAFKTVPLNKLGQEDTIARFEREMAAVGQLRHPNIVHAMDAGEEDRLYYLVLELNDGTDVATVSKSAGQLKIADACEIIRQTALGLEHAHERGLVHRDVKPSNLLLSSKGEVRVADLGLATLQSDGSQLTSEGQFMGTLDYVAPEQIEGPRGVDPRADLYSLGCTAYQLLTGHAPFDVPESGSPLKKLRAHESTVPKPVSDFREDVPGDVVAVIDKLLQKSPAARVQSAGEVATSIASFTKDSDLINLVSSVLHTNTASTPTARMSIGSTDKGVASPALSEKPQTTSRGYNWKLPVLGAICAAIAACGFFALRADNDKQSEDKEVSTAPVANEPEAQAVTADLSPPDAVHSKVLPKTNIEPSAIQPAIDRAFQNGLAMAQLHGNARSTVHDAEGFMKEFARTSSDETPPSIYLDIEPLMEGAPQTLAELKRLIPIHHVTLRGQAPISDTVVASLDIPGLAELVAYSAITDRQLAVLPSSGELVKLQLKGPVVPNTHDRRVQVIAERYTKLKELELNAAGMTVETLRRLEPLKLRRLRLYQPSREALETLGDFTTLRTFEVDLAANQFEPCLGKLPDDLEELRIFGSDYEITDQDLISLTHYHALRMLQLHCRFSEDALRQFSETRPECVVQTLP